jgi:hypothetical protein
MIGGFGGVSALMGVALWEDRFVLGVQDIFLWIGWLCLGAFMTLNQMNSRVVLAENGIEKQDALGRTRRWSYRDVRSFEMRPGFVRIDLTGGRSVKVYGKMTNSDLVPAYLQVQCPPVQRDAERFRWKVVTAAPSVGNKTREGTTE